MSTIKKALGAIAGMFVAAAAIGNTSGTPADYRTARPILKNPRFNGNTGRRNVKYRLYKKNRRAGFA